ncbi:hypothetical protein CF098_07265 [Clostridium sporogenes]|uniref:dsDNA nuclease domain-containing protein n=1 Tax=Clostridium sporogenes TaxID=1509 RepID=UPI0005ED7F78|nr:dsDNA nuclease domain-containing protein [Clostridium sporogenes]
MKNQTVNAGVSTANGIEFQKHCALYFWLDNYHTIKDEKYFIYIEHHEDIFFCYKNDDDNIYHIDAYQAKKSSDPWNSSTELSEIIKKITHVGLDLYEDDAPKSSNYIHTLSFVTNDSIKLNAKDTNSKAKVYITINAANDTVKYTDIAEQIKTKLVTTFDDVEKSELDNVYLKYIDLPKKYEGQKAVLVYKCQLIFNEKIIDYNVAVETLLLLFRKVENNLNNGNIARLSDTTKSVSSDEIKKSIDIITTKKLAFDFWRSKASDICKKLEIPIREQKNFILDFENCFDRFKDLTQTQHLNILLFVRKKMDDCDLYDELECINWLYEEFIKESSSQLSPLSIKAAIYASYIEVKEEL